MCRNINFFFLISDKPASYSDSRWLFEHLPFFLFRSKNIIKRKVLKVVFLSLQFYGVESFLKLLATQLEQLMITRYLDHVQKDDTFRLFLKHFSTFEDKTRTSGERIFTDPASFQRIRIHVEPVDKPPVNGTSSTVLLSGGSLAVSGLIQWSRKPAPSTRCDTRSSTFTRSRWHYVVIGYGRVRCRSPLPRRIRTRMSFRFYTWCPNKKKSQ